jgi:hypothetical protein
MRAETDYWVQPAGSPPLLVVHDSVDASFHEALRDQVLPEIRSLVGERRVRIVFDREGWSCELFTDLLEQGFDFTTYRKGFYEPLDEGLFDEVTFQPSGSLLGTDEVTYQLAETTFEKEGWPRLRLIAVKKKNGGQTHIVFHRPLDLGSVKPRTGRSGPVVGGDGLVDVWTLVSGELVQVCAERVRLGRVGRLLGGAR